MDFLFLILLIIIKTFLTLFWLLNNSLYKEFSLTDNIIFNENVNKMGNEITSIGFYEKTLEKKNAFLLVE